MSSEKLIEETIPGEWWWIGTILGRGRDIHFPGLIGRVDVFDRTKDGFTTTLVSHVQDKLGTIKISGDEAKRRTTLRIETPEMYVDHWQGLITSIRSYADDAQQLRKLSLKMTPEGAIEYYYRSRAAGSKTTLA